MTINDNNVNNNIDKSWGDNNRYILNGSKTTITT